MVSGSHNFSFVEFALLFLLFGLTLRYSDFWRWFADVFSLLVNRVVVFAWFIGLICRPRVVV